MGNRPSNRRTTRGMSATSTSATSTPSVTSAATSSLFVPATSTTTATAATTATTIITSTIAASTSTPDDFLCPITREVMENPVVAADGFSYEKAAIEQWIQAFHLRQPTSPMTNLPLLNVSLIPNHTLRSAILQWSERSQ